MERRNRIVPSLMLLATVIGAGTALGAWKYGALQDAEAAASALPEPVETVTVATAGVHERRPTTTAVGTVLALRSITLRNEFAGTVRRVELAPGAVVDAGTVLVALDVAVEKADLAAQQAQAALAETVYRRMQNLRARNAVSAEELDLARAEHDVALARVERIRAIIERKTIRAPFRARLGIADVHPGQYLNEGTAITTLQGVDDGAHVNFQVAQQVAAALSPGDRVRILAGAAERDVTGSVVAVDARIDPRTRNALVRARVESAGDLPAPGASVRVEVPVAPARAVVTVPVNALRRGPEGARVFVIEEDAEGRPRAQLRAVHPGAVLGDTVVIESGLAAGERVAATGSFKLRDRVLVAIAAERVADARN